MTITTTTTKHFKPLMSLCFGTDPSPDVFRAWAKKRGIFLHPDVAFLVPTKTMGFGVFARRPLATGTTIVSSPFSTCISPYSEHPSFEAPCLKALAEMQLKDNVLHVVLRLLAEAVRPSSLWMPWLKACPCMPNHFFDETAVGPVFGLTSSGDVGSTPGPTTTTTTTPDAYLSWTGPSQQLREVNVMSRWRAVQEAVRRYPEHWPEKRVTFSLFCECLAQVLSRNFHREQIEGREGPYLIPGVDIINHSANENGRFEVRGGGRKHPMTFCVVATRPISRGEQVLCSYGRIGAPRFAIEFQFVTESILREDMLRFSVDVIAEMTSALLASETELSSSAMDSATIQRRIEWLQRLGILCDEGFYIERLLTSSSSSAGVAEKDVQTLLNVFYLMTAGPSTFDDLIHSVNREWRAERAAAVAVVTRGLRMRAEAARAQLAAAESHLSEPQHDGRRELLRLCLNSELEMIELVQRCVSESD